MVDPRDPFEALRRPVAPLAPRPAFAAELRARLDAALTPDPPRTTAPQEAPMSSTTGTTDAIDTPAVAASPLAPYLVVDGAAAALDWYRDVLGAIETTRFVGDDGKVGHAEVTIGGARLMLADEYPEMDLLAPGHRGGTTVTLHLEVVDVDHTHRLAVEGGADSQRAPSDQGHGNRNATIVDPFGHRWMLSQPLDAERTAAAFEEHGIGGSGDPEAAATGWTVSGRPPVEPGYLVLHTGDLARATAFFGAVFDWQTETGGAGGQHVANTRFPMGFSGPLDDAPDRPVTAYFRVDDIEEYAARIEAAGGRVLSRTDYPSGGNAVCIDDQGLPFELFQPAPGY